MVIYNDIHELAAAQGQELYRCNLGRGQTLQTLVSDVENKVEMSPTNPAVKDQCNPEHSSFGIVPENKEVLKKQLKRLEDAITLEELKDKKELFGVRDNNGNFHSLKGNREGQLAGALHGGWRLIFKPNHEPTPIDANGKLDWSKVTDVEILEIYDYHNDPEFKQWQKENTP
jgi:proteic killer suppression protein